MTDGGHTHGKHSMRSRETEPVSPTPETNVTGWVNILKKKIFLSDGPNWQAHFYLGSNLLKYNIYYHY